ncbi:2-keto-4-pentenoate hydratase [Enemella sp. A6]|uniref:2-keto-4-pentenoate hydratase n=1 Tax=Enemella sp. A6 TaxID=3440152 RepID=UPI003EC0DF4E
MEQSEREQAAADLMAAYSSRRPIDPLINRWPDMEIEDSYAIQLLQMEEFQAKGRYTQGHKVGLTSAVVQKQIGVSQPDFGHLLDDFFHLEHLPIPFTRYIQPKVEPEIAFVLGKPLTGPGVTVAEAVAAIDYVLPALEIVDSRIVDWKISIYDTIADNASSGGVVLGSTPRKLTDLDLRMMGCVMHRNGQQAGTGLGGAVLGSPITSLVWLANTLGPRGVTLEAGHVVLPGSITPMVACGPGDTVTATFAGLGSVTARFDQGDN